MRYELGDGKQWVKNGNVYRCKDYDFCGGYIAKVKGGYEVWLGSDRDVTEKYLADAKEALRDLARDFVGWGKFGKGDICLNFLCGQANLWNGFVRVDRDGARFTNDCGTVEIGRRGTNVETVTALLDVLLDKYFVRIDDSYVIMGLK